MGGVQSLNEPDVYTGLGRTTEPTDAAAIQREAALRPVVRACTRLLLHAQRLRHPDKEVIVIKTRSSVVRCHAPLTPTLTLAFTLTLALSLALALSLSLSLTLSRCTATRCCARCCLRCAG